MSQEFCRDVPDPRGVQKVCVKKFVCIFRSLTGKTGDRGDRPEVLCANHAANVLCAFSAP